MTPIDRSHANFYSSSTVTMAVSCIVSEIKRDIVTARTVKLTYLPMAADTDSELSESFPISRNT